MIHLAGPLVLSSKQEIYMHSLLRPCLSLVLLSISSIIAFPQATAVVQITGAVKDVSGGALPNAKVTVTQTNTGFTRQTTSGPDGEYVLRNLPVGPYRLEASAPGFKNYIQEGIVLQVNTNPTINVVLQVGEL